jgi:hypothetical protein
MFTIQDFERARAKKSTRSILESILFSVQKNEVAYAMNLYNNHYRGVYAEKMVGNKLLDHNFDVTHYGETHDFDLLINDSIRAEVKLATIQPYLKNSTRYTFHKIKPEYFDIIFFVFLNPLGLSIKWTDSEMFIEWAKEYRRGKNGYQITFDQDMVSKKLVYNESFESFVGIFKPVGC